MCGVFGFVSRNGRGPDVRVLGEIARGTEQRGPHAFGFSWLDGQGRLRSFKQEGRISDHLALLNMAADARLLIGHCRFATQGEPADNVNNHPHPVDGGWLVHNGMIHNYREIVRKHRFCPVSDCDSEVLGLLIESSAKGTLLERCTEATEQTGSSPLVMLGLWSRPGRMVIVRSGNPLHVGTTGKAAYIASLATKLPGRVSAVVDDSAVEIRWSPAGARYDAEELCGAVG